MEDVCLDRMNAFVKSNIRLYLGMSAWHRPLHFVSEQMLISRERKKKIIPHFVSEVTQRNSGNRLVQLLKGPVAVAWCKCYQCLCGAPGVCLLAVPARSG